MGAIVNGTNESGFSVAAFLDNEHHFSFQAEVLRFKVLEGWENFVQTVTWSAGHSAVVHTLLRWHCPVR